MPYHSDAVAALLRFLRWRAPDGDWAPTWLIFGDIVAYAFYAVLLYSAASFLRDALRKARRGRREYVRQV